MVTSLSLYMVAVFLSKFYNLVFRVGLKKDDFSVDMALSLSVSEMVRSLNW